MVAANGVLGKGCYVLRNPKHMVPSLGETGARLFVTRFLSHFISTACVMWVLERSYAFFLFSIKCWFFSALMFVYLNYEQSVMSLYIIEKLISFTLSVNRLLEEGGTMFTFEGTSKKSSLKTVIRVHNPQFYWKVKYFGINHSWKIACNGHIYIHYYTKLFTIFDKV